MRKSSPDFDLPEHLDETPPTDLDALRARVADLTATNEMLHHVYDAEQAERRRLRETLERIAHWKSEWWDAEDCNAMQTVAREALR